MEEAPERNERTVVMEAGEPIFPSGGLTGVMMRRKDGVLQLHQPRCALVGQLAFIILVPTGLPVAFAAVGLMVGGLAAKQSKAAVILATCMGAGVGFWLQFLFVRLLSRETRSSLAKRPWLSCSATELHLCWRIDHEIKEWHFAAVEVVLILRRWFADSSLASHGNVSASLTLVPKTGEPDGQKIVLIEDRETREVHEIFEELSQRCCGRIDDATVEMVELPKVGVCEVSRAVLSGTSGNLGSPSLRAAKTDVLLYQASRGERVFWYWFGALGAMVLAGVIYVSVTRPGPGNIKDLASEAVVLLGGAACSLSLLAIAYAGLRGALGNARVEFDCERRLIRWVKYSWYGARIDDMIHFDEIGALQLCDRADTGSDDWDMYEINVIVKERKGCRHSLVALGTRKQQLQDAQIIAELLAVDIIDHTWIGREGV